MGTKAQDLLDLLRQREAADEGDVTYGELGAGAAAGATAGLATAAPVAAMARRTPDFGRVPQPRAYGQRNLPTRVAPVGGGRRGLLRAGVEDLIEGVARNPRAFVTAETLGGAGAGAAITAVEEEGYGPVAQTAAGVVAGAAGAGLPTIGYNAVRRGLRWGMENMLPFTEAGAEARASRRLQDLAGDTADAEIAAAAARNAPRGVTPARATGDERLMGLEQRILDDDPALDNAVRRDLEEAANRAQGELASVYGTPRGKDDWRRAVFTRVAAPGTEIPPGAATDEMLDTAYDSFERMYAPVKGLPMRLQLFTTSRRTPLRTMLQNSTQTRTVLAGTDERSNVAGWLDSQYEGLARLARKDGMVDSGDLLEFRSNIRTKARRLRKAPGERNSQMADLLDVAEDRVTQVLQSQLSQSDMTALRSADQLYGDYKVVEKSVFNAGDKPFGPEHLLLELKRSSTSPGAYARGAQEEMRALGQSGRAVSDLLKGGGRPEMAAAMVRGMTDEGRRDVRAQFVQAITERATKDLEGGGTFLSGQSLLQQLRHGTPTARALGMSNEELGRLDRIAQELATIQRKSPGALKEMFNDGPANILQLIAIVGGGRQARIIGEVADVGPGRLALASYFTNKMRKLVETLTTDNAKQLLIQAHRDPELYAALLTRRGDPKRATDQALRTIGAFLQPAAVSHTIENAFEEPDRPSAQELLEELRQQAGRL